jgi:predicted MFS family arabinose efflux permease
VAPEPSATAQSALPRSFADLARANLAAQAAEQISMAAVPIVAVMVLQAGPREIGWLAAAQSLPFLLLSIPLGLRADSHSRRGVMLLGECLRALAMVGLLLTVLLGAASLPLLGILGFLGATGTVAFTVAAPALVPQLVSGDQLGRANSRLELARSLAFAAGPALAGALVAAAGASSAFVLATLLTAAALTFLLRLPDTGHPTASGTRRQPMAELRAGIGFVWHHQLLRPIFLCAVLWNISWFVLQAAYVPHAMTRLGLGATGVGVTLAFYGIGMVAGALLAPRLMRGMPFGQVILLGPLVSVAAASLMASSAWWPWPVLAGLSYFLFGLGPIIWTVSTTTLRQTVTRNDQLGRVGAIFLTANAGARPLGAAAGALIGTLLAPQAAMTACLVVAALGFVLQAAVIILSGVRNLSDLPVQAT